MVSVNHFDFIFFLEYKYSTEIQLNTFTLFHFQFAKKKLNIFIINKTFFVFFYFEIFYQLVSLVPNKMVAQNINLHPVYMKIFILIYYLEQIYIMVCHF